jgi:hypothetical protein
MQTELISDFFKIIKRLEKELYDNGIEVPAEVTQMIKDLGGSDEK